MLRTTFPVTLIASPLAPLAARLSCGEDVLELLLLPEEADDLGALVVRDVRRLVAARAERLHPTGVRLDIVMSARRGLEELPALRHALVSRALAAAQAAVDSARADVERSAAELAAMAEREAAAGRLVWLVQVVGGADGRADGVLLEHLMPVLAPAVGAGPCDARQLAIPAALCRAWRLFLTLRGSDGRELRRSALLSEAVLPDSAPRNYGGVRTLRETLPSAAPLEVTTKVTIRGAWAKHGTRLALCSFHTRVGNPAHALRVAEAAGWSTGAAAATALARFNATQAQACAREGLERAHHARVNHLLCEQDVAHVLHRALQTGQGATDDADPDADAGYYGPADAVLRLV